MNDLASVVQSFILYFPICYSLLLSWSNLSCEYYEGHNERLHSDAGFFLTLKKDCAKLELDVTE